MGNAGPQHDGRSGAERPGGGGHGRPADFAARSADFARRFAACHRLLWLITVGIVQDRALADDVVQEAALTALGKLDQFDLTQGDAGFAAWMSQIVRYVALNAARKARGRRADELDADALPAAEGAGGASASADGRDLRLTPRGDLPADQRSFDDRVTNALRAVGETARCCLLLRTIEGLDYAEISRLLQIPEGTAMSHVHRTRLLLRERLADLEPRRGGTGGSAGQAARNGHPHPPATGGGGGSSGDSTAHDRPRRPPASHEQRSEADRGGGTL